MKTILITGKQGIGKSRSAKVAAQIAAQHHGLTAAIVDAKGQTGPRNADLLIVCQTSGAGRQRIRADRVLHLDRFPHPCGRAVTFALREAVDALAANTPTPKRH